MTPPHLTTLSNAVSAAIKRGCNRATIDVPAWTLTYPGTTEDDVREIWAIALAKVPPNSGGDDMGDGK